MGRSDLCSASAPLRRCCEWDVDVQMAGRIPVPSASPRRCHVQRRQAVRSRRRGTSRDPRTPVCDPGSRASGSYASTTPSGDAKRQPGVDHADLSAKGRPTPAATPSGGTGVARAGQSRADHVGPRRVLTYTTTHMRLLLERRAVETESVLSQVPVAPRRRRLLRRLESVGSASRRGATSTIRVALGGRNGGRIGRRA